MCKRFVLWTGGPNTSWTQVSATQSSYLDPWLFRHPLENKEGYASPDSHIFWIFTWNSVVTQIPLGLSDFTKWRHNTQRQNQLPILGSEDTLIVVFIWYEFFCRGSEVPTWLSPKYMMERDKTVSIYSIQDDWIGLQSRTWHVTLQYGWLQHPWPCTVNRKALVFWFSLDAS